jgi:hypothetical protein
MVYNGRERLMNIFYTTDIRFYSRPPIADSLRATFPLFRKVYHQELLRCGAIRSPDVPCAQ